MARKLKDNELKWIKEMEKLLKKMPKGITLFADGQLNVVDTKQEGNFQNVKHFQPLYRFNAYCGGGDPWS